MSRVPLYKAAETEMVRRIRSGEWEVGRRLPNEFGLADEFGVSQGTMRRALMTLEGQGLLSRKPGRGTVVAEPRIGADDAPAAAGFDRLADTKGIAPTLEVFRSRAATRGGDAVETALFGTARLAVLERTLKTGGARFALDEIAVPEILAPALPEDSAVTLPDLLEELGIAIAQIDDRLTAQATSMGDSVALSVDRHSALLVLTRVARNADGAVVARQVLRMVTDQVGYAITLTA